MLLRPYSSRGLAFAWGPITFDGLAKDALKITPNSDITSTTIGASGDRAPSINPDWSCLVEVTLLQTSMANQKLGWIVQEQRRNGGLVTNNFTLDDYSQSEFALFRGAYIQSGPEQSFASESGERVWTFNAEMSYDSSSSGINFDGDFSSIEDEVNAVLSLAFD